MFPNTLTRTTNFVNEEKPPAKASGPILYPDAAQAISQYTFQLFCSACISSRVIPVG